MFPVTRSHHGYPGYVDLLCGQMFVVLTTDTGRRVGPSRFVAPFFNSQGALHTYRPDLIHLPVADRSKPLVNGPVVSTSQYQIHFKPTSRLCAGVGVHLSSQSAQSFPVVFLYILLFAYLSLATSEGDVDESSGVLEALESSALGDLGLLLLLNLYFEIWSVIVFRRGDEIIVYRGWRTLGV